MRVVTKSYSPKLGEQLGGRLRQGMIVSFTLPHLVISWCTCILGDTNTSAEAHDVVHPLEVQSPKNGSVKFLPAVP